MDVDFTQPIPIFPLPNAVLLPSAILPLHLFESRYREMAADCLADSRLIAMALLRPGYEARYYTHCAGIHPVLCVGKVVRDERLNEGEYNILLQGICRATVQREDREKSYRRGWLAPVPLVNDVSDEEASRIRSRITRELDAGAAHVLCVTDVLNDVVHCPNLSLSDMLDLVAHHVFPSPEPRQCFLTDPDVRRRAACLVEVLAHIRRKYRPNPESKHIDETECETVEVRSGHREPPSSN